MPSSTPHVPMAVLVGAALGEALSPQAQTHLATCEICRSRLDGFALDLDALRSADPPPTSDRTRADQVSRVRRRRQAANADRAKVEKGR